MDRPQYVNWIVREDGVVFEDQQPLNCYRLSYVRDDAILDDWALHIRKQYVPDGELEEDAALNKLTVEEYLRQYIIPQKGEPFGPTARSNDISEILFADLFEFILNYEVPRCKQHNRSGKNESEHGTDIIAYRFFAEGKAPHKNDENYYRKKLRFMGKSTEAADVARFQQKTEYPYRTSFVGAAISSLPAVEKKVIVGIMGADLELKTDQSVFYVHGADLMSLTHQVFERCTK